MDRQMGKHKNNADHAYPNHLKKTCSNLGKFLSVVKEEIM